VGRHVEQGASGLQHGYTASDRICSGFMAYALRAAGDQTNSCEKLGGDSKHLSQASHWGLQGHRVRVLEAEAGIPPLQITLDQAVLRNQALRGSPSDEEGQRPHSEKVAPEEGSEKRGSRDPHGRRRSKWALRMLKLNNWDTVLLPNLRTECAEAKKGYRSLAKRRMGRTLEQLSISHSRGA